MDDKTLAKYRHRARTDLWFLCKEILQIPLVEEVHRPVTEFFVQKNPDVPIFKLSSIKHRLLLDPRNCLKTAIDMGDTVQWIINYSWIRILLGSGTLDLVKRQLEVVKNYFLFCDDLRTLFPEYALEPGKDGTKESFITPARKDPTIKEPTVACATNRSVKAGQHYDIIKFDDIVNETNSKTPEGLQGAIDDYNRALPLLDPRGYSDVIDTVYDAADLSGWIMDHEAERKLQGKPAEFLIFRREAVDADANGHFTEKSKVLFPRFANGDPWLTYEKLKSEQAKDPLKFANQYLNRGFLPELGGFSEEMLRANFLPASAIWPLLLERSLIDQSRVPRRACVYIIWDPASSDDEKSDYRAGAVGMFDKLGRLYIIDLAVGRYNPTEFVHKMLELVIKWYTWLGRMGVEKSAGVEYLQVSLQNAIDAYNVCARNDKMPELEFEIDWIKPSPKKRKHDRILALHPLLKQKQLFFNSDLPDIKMLIRQFVRYKPGTSGHDDIPDAISRLVPYKDCIDYIRPPERQSPEPEEIRTWGECGYGYAM